MNNKTVEKFEFLVKLREDRVWDLYLDGIWVGSYGNVDRVLNAERSLIEEVLSKTEKKGKLAELKMNNMNNMDLIFEDKLVISPYLPSDEMENED